MSDVEIEKCDVIVIGAGPAGLAAAALLGRAGLSVKVIEQHSAPFGLPRAGHIDGEVLRVLQNAGAHEGLLADATPYGDYTWYNGQGEVLFVVNFGERSSSHWYSDYTIFQPVMERGLLDAIDEIGAGTTVEYGMKAVVVSQTADYVDVAVQASAAFGSDDGSRVVRDHMLRAKYVIAAEGAGSQTRERLAIGRTEIPFDSETWLILDTEIVRRWPNEMTGAQYCDPRRPAFETPLGRRHHRWEWSLLPGEVDADFLDSGKAWELLRERGIGPDDVSIVRQQIYKFESRTAEKWSDGRVYLIGDAAHTMPPFMGQGMCAGIRDAANLAWKIALVLSSDVSSSLLDTYEIERRPHAAAWAEISRSVGEVSCVTDPAVAAERDRRIFNGERVPLQDFPHLQQGLLTTGNSPSPSLVGTLFPQSLVETDGGEGLFDDVVGSQFVIALGGPTPVELADEDVAWIHSLGGCVLDFTRPLGSNGIHDVDGTYYRYFASHEISAAVLRPDRYVYGTADSSVSLGELVSELRSLLVSTS